ncbi:MAG: ABC transporter ATP-binding protein/permease [Bacteroidales bacterium]|nr:ABC transporter ATP-binding protein/permease [Bacteroidales bacterium]
MKNYKKYVVLNVGCNILYIVFSLFSIVMVVPFVSVLFGLVSAPEQLPTFSLSKDAIVSWFSYYLNYYKETQGFFTCLIYICAIFITFTFLSNLFRYLAMFFLAPLRNGILRDLRNDIYHKLTILPVSFFSTQKRGDIIARMTTDVGVVEWTAVTSLQMVVKDPFMIIIFAVALFVTSWQFMLFILVVLPLPLLIIRKISASLNKNSIKGQQKAGDILSFSEEALSMVKIAKGLNAEKTMEERFTIHNKAYQKLMNKVMARNELAAPISEFFSMMILSIVIVAGGIFVLKGQLHPGVLIGFTVIFSRIISPIKELIKAYYNFKKGEASAKRLYEILDAEEKVEEKSNPVFMQDFKDKIEFKNVGFSYEGNDGFDLKNISFTINKGEKIAIVGASGAGKSTLFDLIPRFADVTEGEILIDGVDVRDFQINSLREHIGVVTQSSILFNDTILANITFGKDEVDMEKVKHVARLANAEEFIENLPMKYNTNIGDSGTTLSGGQRQRLCIARALYNNPQILLMDEATSAMDTENEHKVAQAINNAMQDRTMISIAHRLSTIVNSDKIIVLDHGRIVEVGTHQSLLEKDGFYSKLVKMQSL